jgi:hypothetical protein
VQGFYSQQAKLGIPGTNRGQINGAIDADNVNFQSWTPRKNWGAFIGAGSTDKSSGNGAWAALAGFGSTYATTAYQSRSGLWLAGPAGFDAFIVRSLPDGTGDILVGKIGQDGVPVTEHASGTATDALQFTALTWTPPTDCVRHVIAIATFKKAGIGTEIRVYEAAIDATSGATSLLGPAAGVGQQKFAQPVAQTWGDGLTDGIDVSGGNVVVNVTAALDVIWDVKITSTGLDA